MSSPCAAAILGLSKDAVARDLLTEIAIEHGLGFYCATDSDDFFRTLSREMPGVFVIDADLKEARDAVRTLRRELTPGQLRQAPVIGLTSSNDRMIAVALDAPVFFKPDLDGLEAAVVFHILGDNPRK